MKRPSLQAMHIPGLSLVWLLSMSACGSDSDDGGTGGAAGGTGTVSGMLLDGGGGWTLPLACTVSTYYSSLLDPNAPDFEAKRGTSESVSVDAWPRAYELTGITVGVDWYVGARCDVDGDGLHDVGGWYPGTTPTLVAVPATNVDVTIRP